MHPKSMFYFPPPFPAGSLSWWHILSSSEDTEGAPQKRGSSFVVLVSPMTSGPTALWMLPGHYTQGLPQDVTPALSNPQTAFGGVPNSVFQTAQAKPNGRLFTSIYIIV